MRIRDFVASLEAAGELAVVDRETPRELIPQLIKDEEAGANRAMLFRRVRGHTVPVVANLYGTYPRYARGVGVGVEDLWARIDHAVAHPVAPPTVSEGPCFEVVHQDPDITRLLPLMKYHPLDAGPYITSAIVFMKDPMTGRRNVSFIRFMVKGPKKLGFNPKSIHNKAYYEKIALAGRKLEVAFCLGAPTEMVAAAASWIPDAVDEVEVAAALADPSHRAELAMVKCQTVDLEVPAGSEIVIEGVVSTELEPEGPFGDWTGAYARPQMKPSLHLTCVSHRRDPVYQTIMPADSKEQIVLTIVRFYPELEAIRQRYPEILRLTVPDYGLGRLAVLAVARRERIPEMMKAFLAVQCINRVIVVNDDVDVESAEDVLWAVSNRILAPEKVVSERCVDEWWNHLKLGIDTTVDTEDIRHKRPRIVRLPMEG